MLQSKLVPIGLALPDTKRLPLELMCKRQGEPARWAGGTVILRAHTTQDAGPSYRGEGSERY